MNHITAKEYTTTKLGSATKNKISKEGVLKDVHIIGTIGKANKAFGNKEPYVYKESTLKVAAETKAYDGVDSFIGHSEVDGAQRSPKDRIGLVISSYFKEGVGVVGDIQFDIKHPHYESMLWWATNHPDRLMLSHEAALVYNKADNTIVEIKKVFSVDFVLDGNTTEGLFKEGIISDTMAVEDQERQLNRIVSTANMLAFNIIYPLYCSDSSESNKVLTQQEKAVKILPIIQDLVKELKAINPPKTTEATMEYKDINLEELHKARPDIIKAIESVSIDKQTKLNTSVQAAVKDIPEGKRSATFMGQVREAIINGNTTAVKDLVEDRLSLVRESVTSAVALEVKEAIKAEPKVTVMTDEELLNKLNK